MAKNKEFELRMQGMKYALEIANKDGVEGLAAEVNKRGITKLPFTVGQAEAKHLWEELCANMYNNIATAFLYTLHDEFEFTDEQIKKLMDSYNKNVANTLDMDYMGEHYISMEDYAVELKENCDIDIDISRIAACQSYYDESGKNNDYHRVKIETVIADLEKNQYLAAANYLKKKAY